MAKMHEENVKVKKGLKKAENTLKKDKDKLKAKIKI